MSEWWRDGVRNGASPGWRTGKYGDQKYLDDWPTPLCGVHVLAHKGAGVAPWNLCRLRDSAESEEGVLIDDDPLIFFHYHGLRLGQSGRHRLAPPGYLIARRVREIIYEPYLDALQEAAGVVREQFLEFPFSLDPVPERTQLLREARIEAGTTDHSARRPPEEAANAHGTL